MNKLIKLFSILACTALLFSCGNLAGNQAGTTNADAARIVLNVSGPADRTAFAPVTAANLTDIKIDYKKTGSTADYANLATYANAAAISTADAVYLDPDTYDFVISAKAGGFTYKAEKPATTLVKGNNTINAELVLATMGTPVGTGSFELTLTVPDSLVSNVAFYSLFQNGEAIEGYQNIQESDFEQNADDITITFILEGSDLASGMYDIVIGVYADSYRTFEIASYEDSIQIVDDLKTEKAYTREYLSADPDSLMSGTFGVDRPNFYIINGNKMYIGGTGELELTQEQRERAESGYNPFDDAFDGIEEVYIGDGITAIYEYVFYKSTVKKVKGGKGLEIIGDNAFESCHSLEELPDFANVTKICSMAFKDCTALEELPAFANVTELGNCAFQGCTGLKYVGKIKHSEDDVEVSVFDNVTTIGGMVFYNCNAIEEINGFNALTGSAFPAGIKTSGFDSSKLKYIKGFNSLTAIPANVFESNKVLKSIAGFTNVTTIGKEAFRHCDALTEIPAFENVTTIVEYAFIYCVSLKEINGFNSVETIGTQGFACCTALESVSGFASLTTIGNSAFMNCTKLTSFDFASNSYVIGAGAFKNCTGLTDIIIPAAVTAIGYDAFCFNSASSITILNPEIAFNSGDLNHFASGTMTDSEQHVVPYAGTFNFAGTEAQWYKALGYENSIWPNYYGTYEGALDSIGLDTSIHINFNYTVPATNE